MFFLAMSALLACVHRGDVIEPGQTVHLMELSSCLGPEFCEGRADYWMHADGTLEMQYTAHGFAFAKVGGAWRIRGAALEMQFGPGGPSYPKWHLLAFIERDGYRYLRPTRLGPADCSEVWLGWRVVEGHLALTPTRVCQ